LQQVLYVFVNFVYYLIVVLQLLMFARAITSWIMMDEDNTFIRFVNIVTEPIIMPIRKLIEKVEFLRNMPIDISFFIAFLVLVILQNILPVVTV
jgi:YggT family protein